MQVIIASVLLVMTSLYAAQPSPAEITQEGEQGKFHNRMLTSDTEIPAIMCEVSRLLGNGVDPKQIVCIFDVDGTLTDELDPTFAGESTYPRSGAMITFVRSLHTLGITMIASSAWDIFEHTVGRIRRLGLLDVFLSKDAALSTKIVPSTPCLKDSGNISVDHFAREPWLLLQENMDQSDCSPSEE